MSVKVMTMAWRVGGLDPTQKLILLKLADNANEDDYVAFPSISTIASQVGCSERTVQRHLVALEEKGLIHRKIRFTKNGRQRSNLYYVLHPEMGGCQFDTPDAGVTLEGVTGVTPISFNRQKEPSTLTGDRFEEFWSEYPKREGSNPKKPAKLKFDRAVKAGVDPQDIINGAKAYAAHCRSKGSEGTSYVAQALTWLNQERWTDEHTASEPGITKRDRATLEAILRG